MNIIYTADLQVRMDELEARKEGFEGGVDVEPLTDEEIEELEELEELSDQITDFRHGEIMVAVEDFEEYVKQLHEEINYSAPADSWLHTNINDRWPYTHINWGEAADEFSSDYIEVEYKGEAYYVR